MSATTTQTRSMTTTHRNYWRFKLVNKDGLHAQHDGYIVMMERKKKHQTQGEVSAEIEFAKQLLIAKVNPDTDEDGEFAGYEFQAQILEWDGNVSEL